MICSFTTSKKAGYKTITARDGNVALQKARDEVPSLIVLDLMLPEMEGTEVCRHLKADSKTAHIPIIMLTAKAEEVDRVVGLELGADDYVTKPFSPREMAFESRACCDGPAGKQHPPNSSNSATSRWISPSTRSRQRQSRRSDGHGVQVADHVTGAARTRPVTGPCC